MSSQAERVRNYRLFHRLLKNITKMLTYGVITEPEAEWLTEKTKLLYDKLKAEVRALNTRPKKKRGRRKTPPREEIFTKCKREGCNVVPSPGQAYCSPDHAPYAYLIKRR